MRKLPVAIPTIIISVFLLLFIAKSFVFRWPDRPFLIAATSAIILSATVFGSYGLLVKKKKKWPIPILILCSAIIVYSGFWLNNEGFNPKDAEDTRPFYSTSSNSLADLGIENPARMADLGVKNLTYGSGNDFQRKEYGEDVNLKSKTVNASLMLPEWKGKKKKWREKYWKFGVDSFPLNGRISMPENNGVFPLILFVHGNHSMTDYSDAGYQYLTDLLASKGYIAISLDENFINGHWSGDFRGREMPTRAWLMLKHIEQIALWNSDPSHALGGKVDLENIMLVGHSRGGEAVSIASVYNELDHFPDNALQEFNFHFGIKSIISIAPTDYRYQRKMNLKNVNYLSLQGSYDSDESSFWGFRPYQRLEFDDEQEYIKAAVFIDKANHGQFNSTWDRTDMGPPMSWLMNIKPILQRDEQEDMAKVFITAFAESTLKGKDDWLPLFKNTRMAKGWLVDNQVVSNFQHSSYKAIANFEEDINAKTSTEGGVLNAENFEVWKEEQLLTRDGGSQDNNAVLLGWNYGEEMEQDSIAKFSIKLRDSFNLEQNELVISIAQGDPKVLNLTIGETLDSIQIFRIELVTLAGNRSSLNINEIKPISPRIKVKFSKEKSMNKRFGKEWEVQMESFHIPISRFDSLDNIETISEINLIFDQNKSGLLYLDDIGFQETN